VSWNYFHWILLNRCGRCLLAEKLCMISSQVAVAEIVSCSVTHYDVAATFSVDPVHFLPPFCSGCLPDTSKVRPYQ
jgi:hypothetical protein